MDNALQASTPGVHSSCAHGLPLLQWLQEGQDDIATNKNDAEQDKDEILCFWTTDLTCLTLVNIFLILASGFQDS